MCRDVVDDVACCNGCRLLLAEVQVLIDGSPDFPALPGLTMSYQLYQEHNGLNPSVASGTFAHHCVKSLHLLPAEFKPRPYTFTDECRNMAATAAATLAGRTKADMQASHCKVKAACPMMTSCSAAACSVWCIGPDTVQQLSCMDTC